MVWAVAYCFPNFIQPMFKERFMSANNKKSNYKEKARKNAMILIDHYSTAKLSEIQKICDANDLYVSCVIYNYSLHDVKPYKEIIKYIASQDIPPVVLIDNATRLFPQCIISSTLLGTLEEMKLAKIRTYSKELSKEKKLLLTSKSTFGLLTDATWQLRSIEKLYKKDKNKVIDEK
jgi:hypothetical protein